MSFGPVILGVGVVAAAAGFVTMHASSAPRDDGYGSPSKSEQEFLGALGFTLVLAGVFLPVLARLQLCLCPPLRHLEMFFNHSITRPSYESRV